MVRDRRLRDGLCLLLLLLGLNVLLPAQVPAAIYTYTTIDFPGAEQGSTFPTAINNLGQIVGTYKDSTGQPHGFLYDLGTFNDLGAQFNPTGINDSGVISGSNGANIIPITTLPNCQGCSVLSVDGINDLGEIIGVYADSQGNEYTFALLSDGWGPVCSSQNPILYAIGNSGLIAGETNTGAGAFVQDQIDGSCTTYAFPGLALPTDTTFYGINLWGLAVGGEGGNGGSGWSAPPSPFVYEWSPLGEGNWAEIQLTFPSGAYSVVFANGINDFGQIVGVYSVGAGQGVFHGYVTSSGLTVFMISTPLSSPTVTAGGSATATIKINSINNFTGNVMLSCSVSPTSQDAPTCSFSPNPVTPAAGGSVSSTLTIKTTPVTAALQSPNGDTARHAPFLLSILMLAGVCACFQGRRKPLPSLAFACLLFICLPCLSCGSNGSGSSGNGGGGTGGGTAPGTYVITVSAAGQTSQTTSVTLTVQ